MSDATISGHTPQELREIYDERTQGQDLWGRPWAPFGYDAIWAAALTLDDAIKKMKENGKKMSSIV